ncbi:MAG: ion channel [Collimonas sp.]|uniref:ion channel n=1 Tax=Collimonas sp. TaxID=1963772 RepID=UPI0032661DF2
MTKKTSAPKIKHMDTGVFGANSAKLDKIGVSRFDLSDPYHLALTLTWPQFFASLLVVYLLINSIFALLYFIAPGTILNLQPGSLLDAFFFSVETLATVGYGNMAPVALYSHIASTVEIFVSMMLTATMTGLVFVRFSKPKAKLLFASQAAVSRSSDGEPQLMIRVGNGRLNTLHDATARLSTLSSSTAPNGQYFRTLIDLELQRSSLPYFPLTWTVIHKITEDSPLAALRDATVQELAESGLRITVSLTARDPSLGAQIYASHAYSAADIALDMRYADAITANEDDHSVADMRKISNLEPDN